MLVDGWNRVQTLKGETLYTLARSKAFNIVDVTADHIVFVPQDGNGTQRWASREQIERIYDLTTEGDTISPSMIQEHYPNDQNTSYIAAIVQRLRTPQAD